MFLEKLLPQKRINARCRLHEILELVRLYHAADFENALAVSLQYNVFSVHFLSGYLAKNFQQSFDLSPRAILRPEVPTKPEPVTRHLTDYRLFDEPETPSPESKQAPALNTVS